MSMTDPIADLLTRIRNAQSAGKPTVGVGASKLKLAILKVLKDEGYIGGYGVETTSAKTHAVDRAEVSRRTPGHRPHRAHQPAGPADLPRQGRAAEGAGRHWASPSSRRRKGIMTDKQARAAGTGGEVLFVVQ